MMADEDILSPKFCIFGDANAQLVVPLHTSGSRLSRDTSDLEVRTGWFSKVARNICVQRSALDLLRLSGLMFVPANPTQSALRCGRGTIKERYRWV